MNLRAVSARRRRREREYFDHQIGELVIQRGGQEHQLAYMREGLSPCWIFCRHLICGQILNDQIDVRVL
jgi:hypothetical protein